MASSTIPLWGRSWQLTVKYISGSTPSVSSGVTGSTASTLSLQSTVQFQNIVTATVVTQNQWEPEALRMTFDIVENFVGSPYWFADITVYNLDEPTMANFIQNAVWVTLQAGYQNEQGVNSIIWDGPVFQVLLDRENVVDTGLTFHCIAFPPTWDYGNTVWGQYGPQTAQADVVAAMASQIGAPPVKFGTVAQQAMQAKKYPRGKTFFGGFSDYMQKLANDQFVQQFQKGSQQYITEIQASQTPNLVYSCPYPPNYQPSQLNPGTTYSIVGTPQQTGTGVIFTVLLDPRVRVDLPFLMVQIDNTIIRQMKIAINELVTPLDQDGLYLVGKVEHCGDTRGNDWYTEITAMSKTYTSGLLQGIFNSLQGAGAP